MVHKLTGPEHWLVLPDMHVKASRGRLSGLDVPVWNSVMDYVATKRWDGCINLGDMMDFNCISSHNANALRKVEGETLDADYRVGGMVLDQLRGAIGAKARIIYIEGNHEDRVERLIDANPRLAGSVEVAHRLELARRRVEWVRFWSKGEVVQIGKALFGHGLYTNEHHARKHVTAYGGNFFYGHTHDIQLYSMTTIKDDHVRVGQSLGCLCDYTPDYMKGRPNRWQQAFTEFWFQPNGTFNYYITMIHNGRFTASDGQTYGR